MTQLLTPAQLVAKLKQLEIINSPEVIDCLMKEGAGVVAVAKQYCTPGHSPYYKAPYSDDQTRDRMLEHMRDMIANTVSVNVKEKNLHGTVFVRDSAEGEAHRYALYVHTGTYDYAVDPEMSELSATGKVEGMKGMPPRPVIPDAIKARETHIIRALSLAVDAHNKRVAMGVPSIFNEAEFKEYKP
jgi:hypothetical protein